MLNAVVTRTVDHDLLHGFKRVKVKLLRYQTKLAFRVNRIFSRSYPKTLTRPEVLFTSELIIPMVVDFPAPFGPKSA